MCQDRVMQLEAFVILASDHAGYWFAGVLTVVASLIVVIVMLASAGTDNGGKG